MKKIVLMSCLVLASVFSAVAQNNPGTATERANRLSDQMIKELRLNNFQASRLRTINQDKINKMVAIEQKYASDQALVDKSCKGVCKERDKELESFLSTEQYSYYYGARNKYYQFDKDFAAQIGALPTLTGKNQKAVLPVGEKVIPVNRNTAVIKPNDSKE